MTIKLARKLQLAIGVVSLVASSHAAFAGVLVPANLDVFTTRPKMTGEGLLENAINPFAMNTDPNAVARPGQEFTGWIDVRHPALGVAGDTLLGYDRYDRRIDQATTILIDKNKAKAVADVTTDLDHANTAYTRQSGVSVIERSTREYESPAAGAASFDFPLSHGLGTAQTGLAKEEQAIMAQNVGGGNVDVYYAQGLVSNAYGETYHPSFTAGLTNEGVFMANKPVNGPRNTFAHELTHYTTNGDAIHTPNGGTDGAHSSDKRNLLGNPQYDPGQAMGTNIGTVMNPVLVPWNIPNNDQIAGPVVSTGDGTANGAPKVGGISQLARSQVFTTNKGVFGDASVSPYLTKSTNATAGNRVDWNFVADDWITENLGGGADTYAGGRESLYFTAGNPVAGADPAATPDNGGKDKSGLGSFVNPVAWTGSFSFIDVISLNAHYGDYDVNNSGDPSFRASNLDYDVSFVLLNNSIVAGVPVAVYTEGWSLDTFADDWLARWMSPSPAKGVLITAHQYLDLITNQLIGNTQIDAVIASNTSVPEPATLSLAALAVLLVARYRERRADGASI